MAEDPKLELPPANPAADPRSEESFFARERAPSEIRRRPQPPSMAKRIAAIGSAAALLGAILWFTRTGDVASLWVINPGPDAVTIEEPRGIIRGVGLEFDNVAKTAVLRHQVHGTMQPSAPPAKLP